MACRASRCGFRRNACKVGKLRFAPYQPAHHMAWINSCICAYAQAPCAQARRRRGREPCFSDQHVSLWEFRTGFPPSSGDSQTGLSSLRDTLPAHARCLPCLPCLAAGDVGTAAHIHTNALVKFQIWEQRRAASPLISDVASPRRTRSRSPTPAPPAVWSTRSLVLP